MGAAAVFLSFAKWLDDAAVGIGQSWLSGRWEDDTSWQPRQSSNPDNKVINCSSEADKWLNQSEVKAFVSRELFSNSECLFLS